MPVEGEDVEVHAPGDTPTSYKATGQRVSSQSRTSIRSRTSRHLSGPASVLGAHVHSVHSGRSCRGISRSLGSLSISSRHYDRLSYGSQRTGKSTIVLVIGVQIVVEDEVLDALLFLSFGSLLRFHRNGKMRIRRQIDGSSLNEVSIRAGECVKTQVLDT